MKRSLRTLAVGAVLVFGMLPVAAQEDSGSPPITIITIPDLDAAEPEPAPPAPVDNELPASSQPVDIGDSAVSEPAQIEVPVLGRQRPPVVVMVVLILGLLTFAVLGAVLHVRRDTASNAPPSPVWLPQMKQTLRPSPLARQAFEVLTVVVDTVDYEKVKPRLCGRFADYDIAVEQAQILSQVPGEDDIRKRWVVRSEDTGQIVLVLKSGEDAPASIADPRLQSILARIEPGSLRGSEAG